MDVNRLKVLRKEHQLTQADIAKLLGYTRQRYNFYETGRSEPDHDTLVKFAEILDTSTDYLLGSTDDPTPPTRKNSQPDISDESLKFALWGSTDINDAVLDDVRRFAKFALEDEAKKGKQGREGNENP